MTRARKRTLTFRVTDDEFDQLQSASALAGARCLSDFIRHAALSGKKTNIEKRVDQLEIQVRKLIQLSGLILMLAGGAFAQQIQRLPVPQEAAINLPSQPIGPSELLNVVVYNQPSMSRTVRVSVDGMVRLPMLKQQIKASGLLPGGLELAIAQAYKDEGILIDPQVTVNIAEYHSHPIQVGGSVKRPITFQAETAIPLIEAINKAEGLSENAGPDILVTKNGVIRRITVKALIETGDPEANMMLSGGEEVRVPEVGQVFVVGNVKKPGRFAIKQGESSVRQALAYSEGQLRYSTKLAFIYRREANGKKDEIEVPLKKIMDRQAEDVKLVADDILYIPENEKKRTWVSALTALTGVGGGIAAALVYTVGR